MSEGISFKTRVAAGVKSLMRRSLSRKSVAISVDFKKLAMSLLAVSNSPIFSWR